MSAFRIGSLFALMFLLNTNECNGQPKGSPNGLIHNGASQVFDLNLNGVEAAMTNALGHSRYYDMMLSKPVQHRDEEARRRSDGLATNRWRLMQGTLVPLTVISNKSKTLPYYATFDIELQSITTNQTRVIVTTISAQAQDGTEFGIHGGRARHYVPVPPLLDQETNLLQRIERQVMMALSGDTSPQKPTFDRNEEISKLLKAQQKSHPKDK